MNTDKHWFWKQVKLDFSAFIEEAKAEGREIWYRLRLPFTAPTLEERIRQEREKLAEQYAKGYMAGWRECFRACLEAVEEEITRTGEKLDTAEWARGEQAEGKKQ
jgi:hypothetical protein